MMFVVDISDLPKMIEVLSEMWNRFEVIIEDNYAKILLLPYKSREPPAFSRCIEINAVIGKSGVVTMIIRDRTTLRLLEENIALGAIAIVDDKMIPVNYNIVRTGKYKRLYIKVGKTNAGRTLKQLCILG